MSKRKANSLLALWKFTLDKDPSGFIASSLPGLLQNLQTDHPVCCSSLCFSSLHFIPRPKDEQAQSRCCKAVQIFEICAVGSMMLRSKSPVPQLPGFLVSHKAEQTKGKIKTRVALAPWPTLYVSDSCSRQVLTKPGTPMLWGIPFALLRIWFMVSFHSSLPYKTLQEEQSFQFCCGSTLHFPDACVIGNCFD